MVSDIVLTSVLLFAGYLFVGWLVSLKHEGCTLVNVKKGQRANCFPQTSADLYDTDYFLHSYSGQFKKYLQNLTHLPLSLSRCLEYAALQPEEMVLDLGCGRGELAYHCIMKGCFVTAVDYSKDAIDLSLKTKQALPDHLQERMVVKHADFKNLDIQEKFDVIFMADLLEHLYDWKLELLFKRLRHLLKPDKGRLIIHTAPNKTWIKFVFPLKRILDWPNTLRKEKDFYYRRDKYSYDPKMHINEQTPVSIKKLLKKHGFKGKVWCDDGSANLISLLTKKFAGAEIWSVAKIR